MTQAVLWCQRLWGQRSWTDPHMEVMNSPVSWRYTCDAAGCRHSADVVCSLPRVDCCTAPCWGRPLSPRDSATPHSPPPGSCEHKELLQTETHYDKHNWLLQTCYCKHNWMLQTRYCKHNWLLQAGYCNQLIITDGYCNCNLLLQTSYSKHNWLLQMDFCQHNWLCWMGYCKQNWFLHIGNCYHNWLL